MRTRILAVSDVVDPLVYSGRIRDRFGDIDLVLSCGDLPASYLDYIVSMLNVPLFGVRGNHDPRAGADEGEGTAFVDIHARAVRVRGLLIAGLAGSPRYNDGPNQYGEFDARRQVARLLPALLYNRLRFGRYLDILVTHAPPRDVHDRPDRAHRGFATYRWFLRTFRPRYHLHGHVHVYTPQTVTRSRYGDTIVLNVYGHKTLCVATRRTQG
jgi:Icc-related predicted phosphoesterase